MAASNYSAISNTSRQLQIGDYVSLTRSTLSQIYVVKNINDVIQIQNPDNESEMWNVIWDSDNSRYMIENDTELYEFEFMSGDETVIPNGIKKFKLIVFDFDCTITQIHTCKTRLTPEYALSDEALPIYIGLLNAIRFKQFVNGLLKSGIKVAIASYGKQSVILNIMNLIFGFNTYQNPFSRENIITPNDIYDEKYGPWKECHNPPFGTGYSKNNMLRLIQENWRENETDVIDNNEILLIDDDPKNILYAESEKYNAIIIPACKGFDQVYINLLQKFS